MDGWIVDFLRLILFLPWEAPFLFVLEFGFLYSGGWRVLYYIVTRHIIFNCILSQFLLFVQYNFLFSQKIRERLLDFFYPIVP